MKRCPTQSREGFTLLELLVVIAIIGILAAVAAPTMNSFKPGVTAAATRQLLDDVSRARQLAINQRTTVYMVFIPPEFWTDPSFSALPPHWQEEGKKLFDRQFTGYGFLALRSLGDQPGRPVPRYLGPWKTLPEGIFIAPQKFVLNENQAFNIYTNNVPAHQVRGFQRTTFLPFPTVDAPRAGGASRPFTMLPYIAFDYLGRLISGRDEVIPLTRGSVLYARDQGKVPVASPPSILENPVGNTTNAFNLITIDWLTGRGRIERQEVR